MPECQRSRCISPCERELLRNALGSSQCHQRDACMRAHGPAGTGAASTLAPFPSPTCSCRGLPLRRSIAGTRYLESPDLSESLRFFSGRRITPGTLRREIQRVGDWHHWPSPGAHRVRRDHSDSDECETCINTQRGWSVEGRALTV